MRILFLSDNFPPEVNAPANRTYEHCREWAAAGHQVTVITGFPNFPAGRVYDGYRNCPWQVESVDGIRVVRVWTYIAANAGFVRRILDYLSYMVTATVGAVFVRRPDIIVATSPQFFTACAGRMVASIKRRPFVFELRDLWPESIRAVGAMKEGRLLAALERLELSLYRRAEAVVSVTHSFKENLVRRGVDGRKIAVVRNGVDMQRFRPQARDAELADRYGLAGKFVAGYIGTHGMAHGLDTLLDAAERLARTSGAEDIRIVLLGDGAEKRRLQERARSMGLDNMVFIDPVPRGEIARYWALLDVAIIHLRKTELFRTVIPSKLFECMAMGIPVLHGVAGESAEIVQKEGCGELFEPDNAEALCERLIALRKDPQTLQRYRDSATAAAAHYDRRVLAREMLDVLERVEAGVSVRPGEPGAERSVE